MLHPGGLGECVCLFVCIYMHLFVCNVLVHLSIHTDIPSHQESKDHQAVMRRKGYVTCGRV